MKTDWWEKIERAYHAARGLDDEERSRYLDDLCGSDAAMRRQIEALLQEDDNPNSLLNRPAADLAAQWPLLAGSLKVLTGTRVGAYEILEPIGSGGMGAVYRAHDTKLRRDVALKFLPTHLAADPDRLSRFRREAQVLAALNHPRIAQIYGLEESEGMTCIAMELVEGETLAGRLRRGPIPVAEALQMARAITEALEAAHEKGIVHRDLKPANVKVTPEGQVKVLDFGLAKASPSPPMQGDLPESSTAGRELTRAGIILGTAPYMSPEQAKGTTTDQRTDVFSFGCVLYEMLTGQPAFQGDTVTEIIASVLAREPDLAKLPPGLNPKIAALVHRCLQKDLRRRWQDIGDVRVEIEAILEDPRGLKVLDAGIPKKPVWKRAAPFLATAILVALIATAVVWNMRPAPDATPLRRFSVQLGDVRPVISPDGRHIAYRSGDRLWVRDLDSETPREIPGGKASGGYYSAQAYYLAWSPDSQDLVFPADNELRRVSVLQGGSATALCTLPSGRQGRLIGGLAWSSDGETIVFSRYGSGVYEVSARGGSPKLLWNEDHADDLILIETPYGRAVIFASIGEGIGLHAVYVRTPNGERRKIARVPTSWPELVYSPSGHILFRGDPEEAPSIWALPFSKDTLSVTGQPFLVQPSGQGMSVSEEGTLVYLDFGRVSQSLVWRDRTGKVLDQSSEAYEIIDTVSLSPNGNQAVVAATGAGQTTLWLYDVQRFVRTRFALGNEVADKTFIFAFWHRRGDEIYYTVDNKGLGGEIYVQRADGFGQARQLVPPKPLAPESLTVAEDGTADGQHFIFTHAPRRFANSNIWLWRKNEPGKPDEAIDFSQNSESEEAFTLSPNERYIAYTSTISRRVEVYVRPFPEGPGRWQISSGGGGAPLWGPDGTELFFSEGNKLMRVPVSTSGAFSFGRPEVLFEQPNLRGILAPWARYNIDPTGRRFLTVESKREFPQPLARVVQNWLSEFRRAGKKTKD